jgi:activating signal cointegrator 1
MSSHTQSELANRALSLHQPWASLAALGFKPFETRSWAPPPWLIGKLFVVHAAKSITRKHDAETHLAISAAIGDDWIESLPRGAALGVARLLGAWKTGRSEAVPFTRERRVHLVDKVAGSPELDYADVDRFGDYSPGRWIWRLTDIAPFEAPLPCLGLQRLWRWPRAS